MCRDLELAVPGTYDPNQPIIRIQSIAPSLQVITSKQRPRKLTLMGKDHCALPAPASPSHAGCSPLPPLNPPLAIHTTDLSRAPSLPCVLREEQRTRGFLPTPPSSRPAVCWKGCARLSTPSPAQAEGDGTARAVGHRCGVTDEDDRGIWSRPDVARHSGGGASGLWGFFFFFFFSHQSLSLWEMIV